jgi:tRNA(Ile)-lysidine synthase TilS/MesJ
MDPGYNAENAQKIRENAKKLNIPLTVFSSDIFEVANTVTQSPCYLCARMRRGHLYAKAKELGCNKIALGHHMDDAAETFIMNLFGNGRAECFSPVSYLSRKDLHMIRPMIFAYETDITRVANKENAPIIESNCPADEKTNREDTKKLLVDLEKRYPALRQKIIGGMQRGDISGWGIE